MPSCTTTVLEGEKASKSNLWPSGIPKGDDGMMKKFVGYLSAELIGADPVSNRVAIYEDDEENLKRILLAFKGFFEGVVGKDKVRVSYQVAPNRDVVDKLS